MIGASSGNITVTPSNGCGDGPSRTLDVVVNYLPNSPELPSGETNLNLHEVASSIYITNEVADADSYTWQLVPESFGTVQPDMNQVTIMWSGQLGYCYLSVSADNSCGQSDFSEELEIWVDYIDGVATMVSENITIWPNPVSELLNIKTQNALEEVVIKDFQGRNLGQPEFIRMENHIYAVQLQALAPGLYFITVKTAAEEKTFKIIID
jgi:hypothetical protein